LSVVDLLVDDDLTVTDDAAIGGLLTVTGGALLNGTTPTLTIGDAGAEDAKIVFDGNAVNFHIGNDDSADTLKIGTGTALGTTPRLSISTDTVIINELGVNVDTIIRSNGNDNMLFVDGGNNRVGIGTNTPQVGTLHVHTATAGTVTASPQADDLVVEGNTEAGITILSPDDQSARIRFSSPSTNTDVGGATIFYRQNINTMKIGTSVSGGVLRLTSGADVDALKIDANQKVLIGGATSGRASPLQIHTPASGGGDSILLTRADTNTDQQVGSINFGNNTDSDLGLITVKTIGAANSGAILLSSAAAGTTTERMRVGGGGAAQQVYIGKQSTSFGTAGVEVGTSGLWVTRNGGSLSLNQLNSSGGNLIEMYGQGSAVGSIATSGSRLHIGSTEGDDCFIGFGNSIVRPTNAAGSSRDNNTDLGFDGMRFKDLYLSGGVLLGGVDAAHKLDDYEEGSWAPSLGGNATYTNNRGGLYVKIGAFVYVQGVIETNGIGSGSTTTVSGLPFASNAVASSNMGGVITFFNNLDVNVITPVTSLNDNATAFTVRSLVQAGTVVSNDLAIFKTTSRIDFSITYRTDA